MRAVRVFVRTQVLPSRLSAFISTVWRKVIDPQPLFRGEVPLRAALRIAFVLVLPALTLGGCGGTATTDDCHISVDCSVMPFPSSQTRSASARAVLTGPALPPDPAAGARASEACPAALRPATVFPPASFAQRYTGPIIVGFAAPIPVDYALWAGDLSNAFGQPSTILNPAAVSARLASVPVQRDRCLLQRRTVHPQCRRRRRALRRDAG